MQVERKLNGPIAKSVKNEQNYHILVQLNQLFQYKTEYNNSAYINYALITILIIININYHNNSNSALENLDCFNPKYPDYTT